MYVGTQLCREVIASFPGHAVGEEWPGNERDLIIGVPPLYSPCIQQKGVLPYRMDNRVPSIIQAYSVLQPCTLTCTSGIAKHAQY